MKSALFKVLREVGGPLAPLLALVGIIVVTAYQHDGLSVQALMDACSSFTSMGLTSAQLLPAH